MSPDPKPPWGDDSPNRRRRREREGPERLALRQSALFGACYYALAEPTDHRIPTFLRPWPIDEVIRYLSEDERDARVRVHAAAWLAETTYRAYLPQLQRILGRDLAAELQAMLVREGPLPKSGDGLDKRAGRPSIFEVAYDFLSNALGLGSCQRRNLYLKVTFDPKTFVTSLEAQIDVNQPPGNYSAKVDPQNWANAAPLFFTESSRGQVAAGLFQRLNNPPPAGSVSWAGGLSEGVVMSYNPFFQIAASNFLNAKFVHGIGGAAAGDTMQCNLHRCVESTIGFSKVFGGLDVDSGTFDVAVIPGGSRLRATKGVRATDREWLGWRYGYWFNVLGRYWLAPWGAALVYEAAC